MQKYSSAGTSINSTRLPVIYNNKGLKLDKGMIVFDIGCGKYIKHIEEYVHSHSCYYYPYDIYNQPEQNNKLNYNLVEMFTADIIIISNVLNVIKEKEERIKTVNIGSKCLAKNGTIFISIYEGNKSGIGKETKKDCWQNNQTINFYIDELKKNFLEYKIEKKYGVIIMQQKDLNEYWNEILNK